MNRLGWRLGTIELLVVVVRIVPWRIVIVLRRCHRWRIMIGNGRDGERLLPRGVSPRLRVVRISSRRLRFKSLRPGRHDFVVGTVIVFRQLILGRPRRMISGRRGNYRVVRLRLRRRAVGNSGLLGLRHARWDLIEIRMRILIGWRMGKVVLYWVLGVRGKVVLIPMNGRMQFILPVFSRWRGCWMRR